jgi:hypothetical protein
VLTLVNPVTGVLSHSATSNPPSEDERWINNMVELEARQIASQADVDAWLNKSALDLNALIEAEEAASRDVWRQIPYTKERHIASLTSEWDESPMKECGYVMGAFLSPVEAERPPFSDWNGLISVMANHVAASRAKQRAAAL